MRPIDADALTDKLNERLRCCNRRSVVEACILSVIDMLDSCPTIAPPPNAPLTLEELREMDGEPVEVVRCKDCKHLYFKDFSAFCPHRVSACRPDGFCEYGERRKPEERT